MNQKLSKLIDHPLHRSLGLQTISTDAGNALLTASVVENATNLASVYHGGVIYTLADVCAYSGLITLLDETKEAVTHDIHVSILRPAFLGDTIYYHSSITKLGHTLCFLQVDVKANEKLIATAKVTKSIIDAF